MKCCELNMHYKSVFSEGTKQRLMTAEGLRYLGVNVSCD